MNIKTLAAVILLGSISLYAKGDATVYSSISSGIPEIKPGVLKGYLDPKTLPNALKLVHKAPAPGSAAQ